ncbi:MAG: MBOAT family protein, partial [Saprospiraceae bacterium]|nr:MBOAT family protein [Saprospiraceae bacterium]
QVIWGFFKKVAVADSLAPFVDQCFASPSSFGSLHLLIGVVFYSFQIYCDFSGYSDIAIGLARMMGFDFPKNFRTPYFSTNFSEFWQRWHITLSSWLRDYLYIPLGGNRHGTWNTYRNLMITMLLGGLWHGASWVFVFWGFLHGMYLVVQRLAGSAYAKILSQLRFPALLRSGINMALVYAFTCLAWIFFRATDFNNALEVINGIGQIESFTFAQVTNKFWVMKGVLLISLLVSIEVLDLRYDYKEVLLRSPAFRIAGMAGLIWLIAFFGTFDSNAFIYFQF